MAYPSTLETLNTARTDNTSMATTHPADHNDENRILNALQAKVGVDGSAVTSSHDYKLGEVTSTDKAVGKTATQTLANKTLNSPTLTSPVLGTPSSGTLTNCTGLPEAGLTLADNTTNDVSTTKHGFVPKAPNDTSKFLRGDGTWNKPSVTARAGTGSTDVATNQTVTIAHGLGATPSYIKIVFLISTNNGFGYMQAIYTNGGTTAISLAAEGGTSTSNSQTAAARIYSVIGGGATGTDVVINAPDGTNISFTTTKFNSPSSNTYIYHWEAWA